MGNKPSIQKEDAYEPEPAYVPDDIEEDDVMSSGVTDFFDSMNKATKVRPVLEDLSEGNLQGAFEKFAEVYDSPELTGLAGIVGPMLPGKPKFRPKRRNRRYSNKRKN